MEKAQTGAHQTAPLPIGSDGFGGWLTIGEAVVHCTSAGLPRTSKTVRKWAARSHAQPDNPEISVRREDTGNGYRWMIERTSLDQKIAEELEFEARKHPEHVPTGADTSEPVRTKETASMLTEPGAHMPEPVQTGREEAALPSSPTVEIELLREQFDIREEQVAFLQEELKHRRSTDQALNDVIQGFLTQAENNRAQLKLEAKQKGIDVEWSTGEPETPAVDGV